MTMRRRFFAAVLLMPLLAGCATGPKYSEVVSTLPSLTPSQGRIYFYRPSAFGAAVQPDIKLNGQKVGTAKPGNSRPQQSSAGTASIPTPYKLCVRVCSNGNALLTKGFRVVTFDAPGHGASSGRLSSGPEFARAASAVVHAVGGGPVSNIVGHSLGGFASALAMGRGLAIRRAVFLSPSADVNGYSAQFEALLGVAAPVMASMRGRLERRLGFSWKDLNIPAFAPEMRVPLLVIHDRDDREVVWNDGAAIAQAWPGAELVTTTGLGHHRIVSDPAVIRQVVTFVSQSELG